MLLVLLWEDFGEIAETGAMNVLLLLIVLAVYSYIIPDESMLDKDTIAMRNILLLTIMIQVFAMLHTLAMRMNYYYLIFIPILIPRIASRSKKKYKQIADLSVVVMTVFFMGYFIRNVILDIDPLNIYPYIPFWQS